jgi:hypothetical protein
MKATHLCPRGCAEAPGGIINIHADLPSLADDVTFSLNMMLSNKTRRQVILRLV